MSVAMDTDGTEAPGAEDIEVEEDAICRYCLDGLESGPLISPCHCKGGQKYVHLSCLRQWQRMVLVSQPTHPDFYGDDLRHQTCNVCKGAFTCPPPTRHELMESFTGPEIAAFIEPGCIIGAHEIFSLELERKLAELPQLMRRMCGYINWIKGIYLITGVEAEDGVQSLSVSSEMELERWRHRLGQELSISAHGKLFRLAAQGSLAGVSAAELPAALRALSTPCELVLTQDPPPSCGDDHIFAVGLQRFLETPTNPAEVEQALAPVIARYPQAAKVQVCHFAGGPCETERIVSCLVLGGGKLGWKVVKKLEDAVLLACSLSARRHEDQGDFGGGQTVRVAGLKARKDLNGEVGLTLQFMKDSGRWMVKLRNGEGVMVRPQNLETVTGAYGQVYAFWGDARWSRTQLLGEIARGHWGLCRASTADLTNEVSQRWKGLDGRMVFAPPTAMTEDFMRDGERQMAAMRAAAQAHSNDLYEGDDSEEDQ